jgi:hypothetical protein
MKKSLTFFTIHIFLVINVTAQTRELTQVSTAELIKLFRTQTVTKYSLAKLYGQIPTDTFTLGINRYIGYENSGIYFMSVKAGYFNVLLIDVNKTDFTLPKYSQIKKRNHQLTCYVKDNGQPRQILLIKNRFTSENNIRLVIGFEEFELISVLLQQKLKKRIEALKPDRMGNFSETDYKKVLRLSKKITLNYIFYRFDDGTLPEQIELN